MSQMKILLYPLSIFTLIFCGCQTPTPEKNKIQADLIVPAPRDETSQLRDRIFEEYEQTMQKKQSPVVKLLTWNIIDINTGKSNVDFNHIIPVIRQEDPDFIALQGIDRGVARSRFVDQVAKISEEFGLQFYFGRTVKIGNGDTGNVLFTRYPIEQTSLNRLESPGTAEARTILDVNVRVKEILPLKLVTTTFDTLKPEVNSDTVKHAYQFIEPQVGIMFGDFNASVSDKVLTDLKRNWTLVPLKKNQTAEEEKLLPAHVFIRPAKHWKVISCRVLDTVCDTAEKPLVVELKYLPEEE